MPPFPGAIDDWPADRAHWLQTVMGIRDRVTAMKNQESQSDADYQQWQQERAARKGQR